MPFYFNGSNMSDIYFNGGKIENVYYNGTKVYESAPSVSKIWVYIQSYTSEPMEFDIYFVDSTVSSAVVAELVLNNAYPPENQNVEDIAYVTNELGTWWEFELQLDE